MQVILTVILAYLLGSVPFGLLFARLKGHDPRKIGSGNIGATNVVRAAGKGIGIATLVADILKGYLPVLAALHYNQPPMIVSLMGFALFVGHLFPVYLRFKGGKGVATALGIFLALSPLSILIGVSAFIPVLLVTRYVSLGSLIGVALVPLSLFLFRGPDTYFYLCLIIVSMIFVKHAGNIKRLWTGTENRFSLGSQRKGTEK
jgi:acyl phosphate:glycerol-3-phosphate acyltransferase